MRGFLAIFLLTFGLLVRARGEFPWETDWTYDWFHFRFLIHYYCRCNIKWRIMCSHVVSPLVNRPAMFYHYSSIRCNSDYVEIALLNWTEVLITRSLFFFKINWWLFFLTELLKNLGKRSNTIRLEIFLNR